jgi:methionine-S-sulfoxide reductase
MRPLTAAEKRVLLFKETEPAFSGEYNDHFLKGAYVCRQCGIPLFLSKAKFPSRFGWASFEAGIPGAIGSTQDPLNARIEIHCQQCGGHLGHLYFGEGLTPKNIRLSVNSLSLRFVEELVVPEKKDETSADRTLDRILPEGLEEACFGGGTFWSLEDAFLKVSGVKNVVAGYTGGSMPNPTYEEVCTYCTGHAVAVRLLFDPNEFSYEQLVRLFFEIHDPSHFNRQGSDIGTQYRSIIFHTSEEQRKIALRLIANLKKLGWEVVTELAPLGTFYKAEPFHQNFTGRTGWGGCAMRVRRFSQSPR